MKIHISEHAVLRYRERVGPLPEDRMLSRLELFSRLFSAKPKHIRRLSKRKRTMIVPLPDCFFIFEGWSLVTVLERKPEIYVF